MSVHVIELVPRANEPGKWDMCNPQCNGPGSYPPIDLPAQSGGHTIVFHISGQTAVAFPASAEDAIWIRPGSKPTAKTYAPKGQLGTPVLVNDNKTLIVNDKNSGQGMELHYQLNFNDGSTLDPVIRNGGGGGSLQYSTAIVIAGGIALLLLGLFFGRMLARH